MHFQKPPHKLSSNKGRGETLSRGYSGRKLHLLPLISFAMCALCSTPTILILCYGHQGSQENMMYVSDVNGGFEKKIKS